MMVPDELPLVLRALEDSKIPYALTGALAGVVWGRPRATYDADIVIDLKPADIEKLTDTFRQPDWYCDRDSILSAIRTFGEFNVIHGATGTKVDFWVMRDSPAEAQRFARRRRTRMAGISCWVLSPEDTILAKLEWIKAAPSERQQGDVAGVIEVQGDALDRDYLADWAERLGVRGFLKDALDGKWN
ncbi:MAG: hypothetical protein O7B26_00120 [Planctomycetota bacterium]|nr:hypothetical protein [Planctomycetota bacterium]